MTDPTKHRLIAALLALVAEVVFWLDGRGIVVLTRRDLDPDPGAPGLVLRTEWIGSFNWGANVFTWCLQYPSLLAGLAYAVIALGWIVGARQSRAYLFAAAVAVGSVVLALGWQARETHLI